MAKNSTHDNVYVGRSLINGRGLFAGITFRKGGVVYQPTGKIVHANDIDWDSIGKDGYDGFLQVGGWEYVDARKDPHFTNMNHSCNPNLGFKLLEGKVSMVAIKRIFPGRELTFDYSTTMFEEEDEEPMPCHCRAYNCRGVIGDFRLLPEHVQRKYIKLGIVPSYVLDELTMTKPSIQKGLWQF